MFSDEDKIKTWEVRARRRGDEFWSLIESGYKTVTEAANRCVELGGKAPEFEFVVGERDVIPLVRSPYGFSAALPPEISTWGPYAPPEVEFEPFTTARPSKPKTVSEAEEEFRKIKAEFDELERLRKERKAGDEERMEAFDWGTPKVGPVRIEFRNENEETVKKAVSDLLEENKNLRMLLREMNFTWRNQVGECPFCGGWGGHEDDCPINDALDEGKDKNV